MRLSDFQYDLPDRLIAQHPMPQRGASRLLHLTSGGVVSDRQFVDLPELLTPRDLLVFNDTRVIPARIFGNKDTGGQVEVLVERVLEPNVALVHVKASKVLKPGRRIMVGDFALEFEQREGDLFRLRCIGGTFEQLMERHGHMPLPPYIRRQDGDQDCARYQTVYGVRPGAIAAPTAGLHFDQAMLDRLAAAGIATAHVTLHVGAGTFQPVRVENLDQHQMHSEWLQVDKKVVEAVAAARQRGGRVVAVGTTCVRSLETAAQQGELAPYEGETQLFIRPGYPFRVVDALLTNFHLPRSTLLMLVSAFAGYQATMAAYRHAVEQEYRFFSYGDAMFAEKAG